MEPPTGVPRDLDLDRRVEVGSRRVGDVEVLREETQVVAHQGHSPSLTRQSRAPGPRRRKGTRTGRSTLGADGGDEGGSQRRTQDSPVSAQDGLPITNWQRASFP